MMKWGRRKPKPPSSLASSISHAFPMSWISKLKPKGSSNSEPKPTKEKQEAKPCAPANWSDNRFYGGDDDESNRRLSFGEERVDGEEKRNEGLQSVWCDDSDDEIQFHWSSCKKSGGGEEVWKSNDMVLDIRKARELPRKVKLLPEIVEVEDGRTRKEFEVRRRKGVRDEKAKKTSRRVLEEKERRSDKADDISIIPVEKDIFELEPIRMAQTTEEKDCRPKGKHRYFSSLNSRITSLDTIEEDCRFKALNLEENVGFSEEKLSLEWEKLKEMKIKELLSKGEKQRKQRRPRQSGKVRVYSPRTVARIECKIKAIEDMKKAKKMKRKTTKTMEVEERAAFDSFAVVKSSVDPQRDFRNSMMEMITEKGMRRSDELEELLACYLTLNADEYHDLIIKVFRQVWFELNQGYFGPESKE